ncbi:MAG: type II secretion system protein [Candidatus Gastranaerophilales bacterium]|nr:type II secretion system protein [Candidatus Gastranaerophilales bacterium]
MCSKKSAFTLSEVLISMTLIGILVVVMLSITNFSDQNAKVLTGKKQQAESLIVSISKALSSGDTTGLALTAYTGDNSTLKEVFADKLNTKNENISLSNVDDYNLPEGMPAPEGPLPAVELVNGTTVAFQVLNTNCAKLADGGAPCALAYVDVNEKSAGGEKAQFMMAIYRDRAVSEYELCPGYTNGEKTVELECPLDKPNGKSTRIDTCSFGTVTIGSVTENCCPSSQTYGSNGCECTNKDLIIAGSQCICPQTKPNFNTKTGKCVEACVGNKVWNVSKNACVCPATLPDLIDGECTCTDKTEACSGAKEGTIIYKATCSDTGKTFAADPVNTCKCPKTLPDEINGKCVCSDIVSACSSPKVGSITYTASCSASGRVKVAEKANTCTCPAKEKITLKTNEVYSPLSETCTACIDSVMEKASTGCKCPDNLPDLVNGKCVCSDIMSACSSPKVGSITYTASCSATGKVKDKVKTNTCACPTTGVNSKAGCDGIFNSSTCVCTAACLAPKVPNAAKTGCECPATGFNSKAGCDGINFNSSTCTCEACAPPKVPNKDKTACECPAKEQISLVPGKETYDSSQPECKLCNGNANLIYSAGVIPYSFIHKGYTYKKYMYSTLNDKNADGYGYIFVANKDAARDNNNNSVAKTYAEAATICSNLGARIPTQPEFDVIHTLRIVRDGDVMEKNGDTYYWTSDVGKEDSGKTYYNAYNPKKSTTKQHAIYVLRKSTDKAYVLCVAKTDTIPKGDCICPPDKPNYNTQTGECKNACPSHKEWIENACVCKPSSKLKSQGYLKSNEIYDNTQNICKSSQLECPAWDKLYVLRYKALSADSATVYQQLQGTSAKKSSTSTGNQDSSRATTPGMKAVADALSQDDKDRNFMYHFAYIVAVTYKPLDSLSYGVQKEGSTAYALCKNMSNSGTTELKYQKAVEFCAGQKSTLMSEAEFREKYDSIKKLGIIDGKYWTITLEDAYYTVKFLIKKQTKKAYVVCNNGNVSTSTVKFADAQKYCGGIDKLPTYNQLLTIYASSPTKFKKDANYWTTTSAGSTQNYVFNATASKLYSKKARIVCQNSTVSDKDLTYKEAFDFCKSSGSSIPSLSSMPSPALLSKVYWSSNVITASGTNRKYFDLSTQIGLAVVVGEFSPRSWFNMFNNTDTAAITEDATENNQDISEDIDSNYVSAYQVKGNCRELCDKGGINEKNECINTCENFKVKQDIFNDCKKIGGAKPELCSGGAISYKDCPYSVAETFRRYSSPLVLDLLGDGLLFTSLEDGVIFDLDADGHAEKTAWTTLQTKFDNAFLCLDKNGNGQIDNGKELFGDQSGAATGFDELAKYDENADGVINKKDKVYYQLRLWADMNKNAKVDPGELKTLEEAGIIEIPVDYSIENDSSGQIKKDMHGNIVGFVGAFKMFVSQIVNGVATMVETVRHMIDVFFVTS